jgi:hypothetical protein
MLGTLDEGPAGSTRGWATLIGRVHAIGAGGEVPPSTIVGRTVR